jgi:hypothetical protein
MMLTNTISKPKSVDVLIQNGVQKDREIGSGVGLEIFAGLVVSSATRFSCLECWACSCRSSIKSCVVADDLVTKAGSVAAIGLTGEVIVLESIRVSGKGTASGTVGLTGEVIVLESIRVSGKGIVAGLVVAKSALPLVAETSPPWIIVSQAENIWLGMTAACGKGLLLGVEAIILLLLV